MCRPRGTKKFFSIFSFHTICIHNIFVTKLFCAEYAACVYANFEEGPPRRRIDRQMTHKHKHYCTRRHRVRVNTRVFFVLAKLNNNFRPNFTLQLLFLHQNIIESNVSLRVLLSQWPRSAPSNFNIPNTIFAKKIK